MIKNTPQKLHKKYLSYIKKRSSLNKQPMVCEAQLAATQIGRRKCPEAKSPEECSEGNWRGGGKVRENVQIPVKDNKPTCSRYDLGYPG